MYMILALADGATAVSDVVNLRGLASLFGPVASTTTVWRTFDQIRGVHLRGLVAADIAAREAAWRLEGDRSRLVIDMDATIVTTRTDKADASPTFKRSYGFHPLLAIDTERREILAQMVRPGNAGSNTAEDHVIVLGAAIDALPEREATGHQPGDNPSQVQVELVLRVDAAGQTHWLAEECTDRNIGFSLGYGVDDRVRAAVMCTDDELDWTPALNKNHTPRADSYICEITDNVNLKTWPTGTRLIVRKERPHPGAQLSLFDDIEGYRHTAFITNQPGQPANLELAHRERGAAETVIRDLKACGYANWPFDCIVNNQAWAQLCAMALNLMSRAQRLTLPDHLKGAAPKTIRHRLLHIAGRITPAGHRLDIDQNWPHTPTLTNAIHHTNTLTDRHAA